MSTDQSSHTGAALYSHDDTVAAITSYYKLLAHAIHSTESLLHPPPEGWPQLHDPDVVLGLGYSDEALNLIRHIPYFEQSDIFQIMPDVQPKSYIEVFHLERYANWGRILRSGSYNEPEDERGIPSHLICLGIRAEEREWGHEMWLDTKLGNVIVGSNHAQVPPDMVIVPEDCNSWDDSYSNLFFDYGHEGEGFAWRIDTFFAACERHLREMHWIPGLTSYVLHIDGEGNDIALLRNEQRKQIMRDYGWPGDSWDAWAAQDEFERVEELSPTGGDSEREELASAYSSLDLGKA
ncbi:hypothetical protein F4821DRAFT_248980 [Hypoxylon rubiginosum]|uniref:Uncharacterized protein n=1 Tax=Hypoxylon rubiginosum TaxID=110542 RepID=A0ACC0CMC1_9PEZI|nr:hypothetical protein F4821DRAFT_248980 [Hypoxylon rubiginosum]